MPNMVLCIVHSRPDVDIGGAVQKARRARDDFNTPSMIIEISEVFPAPNIH